MTLSASTLRQGEAVGALRVTYLKPDRLTDPELAARAGEHIHAHSSDHLLSPSASFAYGVSGDFTLALSIAYLQRRDIRTGAHRHVRGVSVNGVEELGGASGFGDAVLLGQYRLIGGEHGPWQVSALAGIKLPTGATHERDTNGERFETEHQPGTNSWDPILGIAVSRHFNSVSVHGGALYQFSTKGAQQTELGDRLQYGIALSYRWGGEHHHHGHGDNGSRHHDHPAREAGAVDLILELNGEWEGRQRIAGTVEAESGGHVLYLSPGVRVSRPEGWSASVSFGVPVAQRIRLSHPKNEYRLVAGLARSF